MEPIRYAYLLKGQNSYMRAAIDAIGAELDPLLSTSDWEESSDALKAKRALQIDTRPTMDAGVISVLGIGLVLFVGNWAGNKLLDELYEQKLKEPVGKVLDKIFREKNVPENKSIEYQQLVSFDDIGVTILIRVPIGSRGEIKEALDSVLCVHKIAADWINEHGKSAEIHCYLLKDGSCNLEPMLYSSLAEIQVEERTKVIREMMGDRKPNN